MIGEFSDLFNTYRVPALHLTSLLLAAAIWRWGGAPERWLIGVYLATMVLPSYPAQWLGLRAMEVGPAAIVSALIDLVAAAAFIGIALQANRNYPLWIAGFQLVALGAHLAHGLIQGVSPLAIALLVVGPSYCQLLLLAAGFIRHTRRERRFGPYRDWRTGTRLGAGWSAS